MEPISLAIGIASLYNAAIDALNRVHDYKEFKTESQITLVTFSASKLKLQNWATALGISGGKLLDAHDPRLDDPQTAPVVQNILRLSTKVFDKVDSTSSSLRLPVRQRSAGADGWLLPVDDVRSGVEQRQSSSAKSRIAWAVGGKAKLSNEVRSFEGLVNLLYEVVPPHKSEAGSLMRRMLFSQWVSHINFVDQP